MPCTDEHPQCDNYILLVTLLRPNKFHSRICFTFTPRYCLSCRV